MTLDEATAYVEGFFKAAVNWADGDDPDNAPTGEPYLTLTSGGAQPANTPVPMLLSAQDAAIENWVNAMLLYGGPNPVTLTLYWRERPSVSTVVVGEASYYAVTCRALASMREVA